MAARGTLRVQAQAVVKVMAEALGSLGGVVAVWPAAMALVCSTAQGWQRPLAQAGPVAVVAEAVG